MRVVGDTMKKLLVSDYDLTLKLIYDFDNDFLMRANVEAIKKLMDSGNIFMLNTGRDHNSIKKEINANKIPYNYLACNDGTILLDENDRLIHYYDIDIRDYDYELLYNLLKKDGIHPHVVLGGICVKNNINVVKIANKFYLNYNIVDDMVIFYPMSLADALLTFINKYPEFRLRTWKQFNKLLEYEVSPKNRLKLVSFVKGNPEMIEDINLIASIYHTKIKVFMDKVAYMSRFGIDKTSMIEEVRNREEIDKDNVYTIGDNYNDFEMIRDYHGYTMPWGKTNLKEVCEGVVPSVKSLIKRIER